MSITCYTTYNKINWHFLIIQEGIQMFFRRPNLKTIAERKDVQALVKMLRKASDEARAEIAQILVDMRDPRATQALLQESESSNPSVRQIAAQALNRIDPEHKYVAAIHMLNDVHRQVRTAAIEALATMGHPKALDMLIRTSEKERDPQARVAAIEAIGKLKDRRGLQALINALDDIDERVRIASADALAKLEDRTSISALLKLHQSDSHPAVRAAAERALTILAVPPTESK
jgi:HEAT repeat protein